MASILITTPDGQTYEFELDSAQMTLGRGEGNTLVVPDGSISTNHGEFLYDNGQWLFSDLGSTNGTKVNGSRVERVELGHGAQFEIGNCAAVFYEEAAPQQQAASSGARRATSSAGSGGYGEQPIDRAARVGFGAKKKVPDGGRGALMAVGVIALLLVLAVAAMFWTGGLL